MFWTGAQQVYRECRRLGLCRSQRDFSRRLLGRGAHYLRLVSNRRGFTSEKTNRSLKRRLRESQPTMTSSAAGEITALLADISRAEELARWLRRA